MSAFMGQFLELKNRENFFKKHKLRLERARSDMIVNTVLPPSVAVHLKKGKHFAKVNYFYFFCFVLFFCTQLEVEIF